MWAYSFSWATEILQILNVSGFFFAFNLFAITIFTLPVIILFKLNLKRKIILTLSVITIFLSLYIYGNHSINLNQKKLPLIENKFNIKVISPNFDLEYGLSTEKIQSRLRKTYSI